MASSDRSRSCRRASRPPRFGESKRPGGQGPRRPAAPESQRLPRHRPTRLAPAAPGARRACRTCKSHRRGRRRRLIRAAGLYRVQGSDSGRYRRRQKVLRTCVRCTDATPGDQPATVLASDARVPRILASTARSRPASWLGGATTRAVAWRAGAQHGHHGWGDPWRPSPPPARRGRVAAKSPRISTDRSIPPPAGTRPGPRAPDGRYLDL